MFQALQGWIVFFDAWRLASLDVDMVSTKRIVDKVSTKRQEKNVQILSPLKDLTMTKTIDLLEKALHIKHASAWAKVFNIERSTLSQAKKVGRLSPALAGNFAIELGENPEHWIAIAAIEAEKNSPLLERLKRSSKQWLYT